MKKYIIYSILVVLFAAGCKKESKRNDVNSGKRYPLTLNVSGFSQVIVPVGSHNSKVSLASTGTNAISDTVRRLVYILRDASGKIRSRINQVDQYPGFGEILDSVEAGTYTAAIVEGRGGLNVSDTSFTSPGDMFFKKFSVTVGNSAVNANVVLARVVAQVEVNIEDAMPSYVNKIELRIPADKSAFSITNNGIPYGTRDVTYAKTVGTADVGQPNFKISGIVFNTVSPFSIIIKASGPNNYTYTKQIDNVTCEANFKSRLSGRIFGGDVGFNVVIKDAFDADSIKVHF